MTEEERIYTENVSIICAVAFVVTILALIVKELL